MRRLKIVTPKKRKFQFWVNLRTEILETKNILDSTNQEGILHKFTGLISTTSKFASSNTAALCVDSTNQQWFSVLTNIVVANSTDHARPLSICFLLQYRCQIN